MKKLIQQAKYPHVLSLDADEALNEQLKSHVKRIKENWAADGYTMNRLTNYCGQWIKHCGWYPDTKLRLFKKGKGSWRGKNPHDKYILDSGKEIYLKKVNAKKNSKNYTIFYHHKELSKLL